MRTIVISISLVGTLALASVADAASIFQINGGGNGHGVGMSQYGAYGYALHGKSYRFILAHYFQGTAIGTANPRRTVRVLIWTGTASFSGATRAAAKKLASGKTYSVRALANGSLAIYDSSGKRVGKFGSPLTVSGRGPLELGVHGRYRGAFEFRAIGGAVQTVNAIGLDDYVRGVISAEMPSSWPMQALETQAVAARTYALTSNVGGNGYQLYPDTRSQMYQGVAAETPSTDAAVAATRGQIVTYHGSPATTFFFASSGGYTENIENVWLGDASEPWLRGGRDPYDGAGANPYHRWSYRMTTASAQAKLGSLAKGRLLGIKVNRRGVSPRVVAAQVVGTNGRTNVTGPQLQSVFALPSTYMTFTTITASETVSSAPSTPSTGGATWLRAALSRVYSVAARTGLIAPLRSTRVLQGKVFSAPAGAPAELQRLTRKGWRTIRHVRLARGGAYGVVLPGRGHYRLVYRSVRGPTITAG